MLVTISTHAARSINQECLRRRGTIKHMFSVLSCRKQSSCDQKFLPLLRDIGSECDRVELGEDLVNLKFDRVDVQLNHGLDLGRPGAEFGDDPSPCDLVAGVEDLESFETRKRWGLSLACNEGLLAGIGWGAELFTVSGPMCHIGFGAWGGLTGRPDRELMESDQTTNLLERSF